MKRIFFAAVLGLSVLMSQSVVNAQSYSGYGYTSPQAQFYSGPVYSYPRYGGWGGGYGYHSSTYEQGVLMGLGQLYQGIGEYNVANSVAAYNWQLARNANLQNNIAERQARGVMYAQVKMNLARKGEENKKKNQVRAKFNAAQPIERLTSKQLDRETGDVAWPALLTESQFEANRGSVQNALSQKFQLHQVSTTESDEMLLNSISEFQQKLENSKDEFRPSDYYAARAFLIRMKQEASDAGPAGRLAASF